MTTVTRFHGIVGTYPEGSVLSVVVRRDGREVTLQVPLTPRPLIGQPSLRAQLAGASYVSGGRGTEHAFHVVSVTDGGPAASSGVRAGDRIVSIAGIDLVEVLRNMPISEADLLGQILPGQTASGPILLEFTVLREAPCTSRWE